MSVQAHSLSCVASLVRAFEEEGAALEQGSFSPRSVPRRSASDSFGSSWRSAFSSSATFDGSPLPRLSGLCDASASHSTPSFSVETADFSSSPLACVRRSGSYPAASSRPSLFSPSGTGPSGLSLHSAFPLSCSSSVRAPSSSALCRYSTRPAREGRQEQEGAEDSHEIDVLSCQVQRADVRIHTEGAWIEESQGDREEGQSGREKREDRDKALSGESAEHSEGFGNREARDNRGVVGSVFFQGDCEQQSQDEPSAPDGLADRHEGGNSAKEEDGLSNTGGNEREANKVATRSDQDEEAIELAVNLLFPVPEEYHDPSLSRPPPEIFYIFTRSPSVCSYQEADRLTSSATLSGEFSSCLRDLFQETNSAFVGCVSLCEPACRVQDRSCTSTASPHLPLEGRGGVSAGLPEDSCREIPAGEVKGEEVSRDNKAERAGDEGQDRTRQPEKGAVEGRGTTSRRSPWLPSKPCAPGNETQPGETVKKEGGKTPRGGGPGVELKGVQAASPVRVQRGVEGGRERSRASSKPDAIVKPSGEDRRKREVVTAVADSLSPVSKSPGDSKKAVSPASRPSPVPKTALPRATGRLKKAQEQGEPCTDASSAARVGAGSEDSDLSGRRKKRSQSVRFVSPVPLARSPYPPPRPASPVLPAASSRALSAASPSASGTPSHSGSPPRHVNSRRHPHPGVLRKLLFQREQPAHETGLFNRRTERCVLYGGYSEPSCQENPRLRLDRHSPGQRTAASPNETTSTNTRRALSLQGQRQKQHEELERRRPDREQDSAILEESHETSQRRSVCEPHLQPTGQQRQGQEEDRERCHRKLSVRGSVNQLPAFRPSSPPHPRLYATSPCPSAPCSRSTSFPLLVGHSPVRALAPHKCSSLPVSGSNNASASSSEGPRWKRHTREADTTAARAGDSSAVASSASSSISAAFAAGLVSGSEVTNRPRTVTRRPTAASPLGEYSSSKLSPGVSDPKHCLSRKVSCFTPLPPSASVRDSRASASQPGEPATRTAPWQPQALARASCCTDTMFGFPPRVDGSPLPASVVIPLTPEEAEAEHLARPRTGRRPWFCGEEYPGRRFPSPFWGRRSRTPPASVSREPRVLAVSASASSGDRVDRGVPRRGKSRSFLQDCCTSCCPDSPASSYPFSVYSGYSAQHPVGAVIPSTAAGGLSPRFCYNSTASTGVSARSPVPDIRIISSPDTTSSPGGASAATGGGAAGGGGYLSGVGVCPGTATTPGQAVYTQTTPRSGASVPVGTGASTGECIGIASSSIVQGHSPRIARGAVSYVCEASPSFSSAFGSGEQHQSLSRAPAATASRTYLPAGPTAAGSARVWRSLTPPSRVLGAAPVLSATTRVYDPDQLRVHQQQEAADGYSQYLPPEAGKSPPSERLTSRVSQPLSAVSVPSPTISRVSSPVSSYTTTRVVSSPASGLPAGEAGDCPYLPSYSHASSTPVYPATWTIPIGSPMISASPTPSFGPSVVRGADLKSGGLADVAGKTLSGVYTVGAAGPKPTEGSAVTYPVSSGAPVVVRREEGSLGTQDQSKQEVPVQKPHSEFLSSGAAGLVAKQTDSSSAGGLTSYASQTSNQRSSPSRSSTSLQPSSPDANCASPSKLSEASARDSSSAQEDLTCVSKQTERREERSSGAGAACSLPNAFKNLPTGLPPSPSAAATPAGAAASAGSPIYRMASVPLGGCGKGVSPAELANRRNSTLSGFDFEGSGPQKRVSSLGRGLSSVRRRREGSAPGGTGGGGVGTEPGVSGALFQHMMEGADGPPASGAADGGEEVGRGASHGSEKTRDGPVRKAFWYRNVSNDDDDEKREEGTTANKPSWGFVGVVFPSFGRTAVCSLFRWSDTEKWCFIQGCTLNFLSSGANGLFSVRVRASPVPVARCRRQCVYVT